MTPHREKTPRRIAITGATGMVGRALRGHLEADGDTVVTISRRPSANGIQWDPNRGLLDTTAMEGLDAVVHLAGENIGAQRWTPARQTELLESRVRGTNLLAETLARTASPPRVLISASAMGIYGDRGDTLLDEDATAANDFLGALVTAWESAADPARRAGIRVVHPRFGMILTPEDGALARMLPMARLGLGGPMGNGRQWWSWIALSDVMLLIYFLLEHPTLAGAVNAATPHPIQQKDFATVLGKVLHRPALLPAPAVALRLIVGEMADAMLLASTRMEPKRLAMAGFVFEYPELRLALLAMLNR